jgi:thiol-disulfide isomerase/thioredoxin
LNPTTTARTNQMQEWKAFFGLVAAIMLIAWGAAAFAAEPRAGEAQPAAGQAQATSKAQQIAAEIQAVGAELAPLFASVQDLFEPAKRQAAAPKAIPALKKMTRLLDQLASARPAGASQGQEKVQLMALMTALGDKDAAATLNTMASSPVAGDAAAGRSAQLFAAWLLTDGKPEAQQKVVDDLAALAKKYPAEPSVAGAAIMLAGTTRPEAKEQRSQILGIVQPLKTPAAAAAVKQIALTSAKLEAQQKLKELEGKPFVLQGASARGGTLSTADFKGKVVLIDFWASWCGPCREELPKLKKFYAANKARGLEIIGVSCDNETAALSKFLAENRDMPWPQLFDAGKPGWHELAAQYNVNSIPTMFLVDKKGILRSVEARGNYEKLVGDLLQE